MERLSLETGARDYFWRRGLFMPSTGFWVCGPFGDYAEDANSVFMTMELLDLSNGKN